MTVWNSRSASVFFSVTDLHPSRIVVFMRHQLSCSFCFLRSLRFLRIFPSRRSFPMVLMLVGVSLGVLSCSDDEDDGALRLDMVTIPAGSFTMGDPSGANEPNERPARTVSLLSLIHISEPTRPY